MKLTFKDFVVKMFESEEPYEKRIGQVLKNILAYLSDRHPEKGHDKNAS